MRAEYNQPISTRWMNYQVDISLDEMFLSIQLKHMQSRRKFKAQIKYFDDTFRHTFRHMFDSVETLFRYIKFIVNSKDPEDKRLLLIDQEGKITVSKIELTGQQTHWSYPTTQQRKRGFNETFGHTESFHRPFESLVNYQSQTQRQNSSQLRNRVVVLQDKFKKLQTRVESINSLGQYLPNSFQQSRRSKYLKNQFGVPVQQYRQAYINGYFCDFYYRGDFLQIFLLKSDNGNQFYIIHQDNPMKKITSKDLFRQIKYLIDREQGETNIKIHYNGLLNVRFRHEVSGIWQPRQEIFQGQKIQCNQIQKLQKLIELNQRNTKMQIQNMLRKQTEYLAQLKGLRTLIQLKDSRIISPTLFNSQAKISNILLTIEDCLILFGFFTKTVKFKASQNGHSAQRFHEACDYMSNTIVLVQTQFGNVIGGFTAASWNKNGAYAADASRSSFLFSITNNDKFAIIDAQVNSSIYNNLVYGPTFGSGHDLHISNKCDSNTQSYANFGTSYKCQKYINGNAESQKQFSGSRNFRVVEYEVYDVYFAP